MRIATAASRQAHTASAAAEAYASVAASLSARPELLVVHAAVDHDAQALLDTLAELAPGVPVHGGTSCMGAMTETGFHPGGLAILAVSDPAGAYGVGVAELGDSPREAAREAAVAALASAGREGEVPSMVWLTQAPGHEEEVLLGIGELFGPHVPIGGGSSSDDTVAGQWRQFANRKVHQGAVVVTVLFASQGVAFSFQSGYDPTAVHAVVTRSDGRTIHELNGRPAAEVYDGWLGGTLGEARKSGGAVLSQTSLTPLGRVVGTIGDIPYFQLSHPQSVDREGGMSLFSRVATGEEVVLMRGSPQSLVSRAGRVARSARRSVGEDRAVAGALVIYCAGCMLTIRERMDEVVNSLRSGLGPGVPFLGAFTFGEQGCFLGGENRHGNLMISVLAFLAP